MRHLLILLLGAIACSVTTSRVIDHNNTGEVCFADGNLVVDFNVCLSSSCDTLVESSCSTELVGNTLMVESFASVERESGGCTQDCGILTAPCDMPDIDDTSTVTITYGDTSTALDELPDCTW